MFRIARPALVLAFVSALSCERQDREAGAIQGEEEALAAGVVRYGDFGAKGDGKTDDSAALARAHEHANRHGLPVKAKDGATYYIGGSKRTIVIQTDTDFGKARFIIDDTSAEDMGAHVFEVRSATKAFRPMGVVALEKGQARIDAKFPGPCMVTVTDSGTRRFIRRGLNQNDGSPQTDSFLVDEDGNIDPSTPIIWDFGRITSIQARPLDGNTLTLSGGLFTTIANRSSAMQYCSRGIAIRRSNVVVGGLTHHVEGEGEVGAPYRGFIDIADCANVAVRDTVLTGRRIYSKVGSSGKPVSAGSYDINMNRALNVSLVNCSQTNDIMDRKFWGIMGTNHCKNLTLERCNLSRFDAHQGVTNATIRASTLGYMGIRLTGRGTFLAEDTTVKAQHFIHLREDYGSTWEGDVVIRNCKFVPSGGRASPGIFGGFNDGRHDFGYTCHMPGRILIDGLEISDAKVGKAPAVFANFNPKLTDSSYEQPYPYVVTREVVCKRVTTASGKPLRLGDNDFMFREVKVSGLGGR